MSIKSKESTQSKERGYAEKQERWKFGRNAGVLVSILAAGCNGAL